MRVLHVIPSLSPERGGPSHALVSIERSLSELGVDVVSATTNDDGAGKHNNKKCNVPVRENNVTRWYFNKRTEFYTIAPSFIIWMIRNAKDYDLIHIHALFSFTSLIAAIVSHQKGVPYVLRPAGVLNSYGMEKRRPLLKKISRYIFEDKIIRRAAALHVTSDFEEREGKKLSIPFKSSVIPLGIEVNKSSSGKSEVLQKYGLSDDNKIVLLVSRLDPVKNIENLLNAIELLTKKIPSIHLVIAGDGSVKYVNKLKKKIELLGLQNHVILTGFLNKEKKREVYSIADCFVLPSYSENFGVAAAEALSFGVPCVLGRGVALASDVASAGAGIIVDIDIESISIGIEKIFSNKLELYKMGKRARILVAKKYSLEVMGENLLNLYNGILEQENRSGDQDLRCCSHRL